MPTKNFGSINLEIAIDSSDYDEAHINEDVDAVIDQFMIDAQKDLRADLAEKLPQFKFHVTASS